MRFDYVVLLVAAVTVLVGVAVVADSDDRDRDAASAPAGGPSATVDCADGGPSRIRRSAGSAALGEVVLIGASYAASRPPDAFGGRGYKIPVSLPEGVVATVSVPPELRSRVGLVFSLDTQDRLLNRGVRGADAATTFVACPVEGRPGRTGWPGGIVVDRPRCATLVVTGADGDPTRHRVPLGRRC